MEYGGGGHQTTAAYGYLVVGPLSKSVGADLDCVNSRLHVCFVCDTKVPHITAICGLWRYESVTCLPFALERNAKNI